MDTYSRQRGLDSEDAVERTLVELRGATLQRKRKKHTLLCQIIGFIRAKPNDDLDRAHTDFLVNVRSDVNGEMLSVPIQTRSSLRRAQSFERKCRRYGWGPIQVVVVEDSDNEQSLMIKVRNALIAGYNALRREFNRELWSYRTAVILQRPRFARRHRSSHEQWCPRFNVGRMCWG